MRQVILFITLAAQCGSLGATGPVSDKIHSDANGPSTVCEVTAVNALNFQPAVKDSGNYSLLTQNDDYFVVMSADEMTVWAFTMPASSKPSSAICSRLVKSENGSISGNFSMRCDGDRAECDAVYQEWFDYHQRVTVKRVKATPKK